MKKVKTLLVEECLRAEILPVFRASEFLGEEELFQRIVELLGEEDPWWNREPTRMLVESA